MNNFSALILAQLDDSKLQKDLQKVQKQPLTFDNVKISNVKFDKSSIDALQAQLDNLTANVSIKLTGGSGGAGGGLGKQITNAINSEINSTSLQPAKAALDSLQKSLLTNHGMKNSAVSSIMQSISDSARNANIQITKVSESFQNAGKNAGQLQSFKISGIDDLGNAVTIIDTFDKKTGQLKSSATTVNKTFVDMLGGIGTMSAQTKQKLEEVLNANLKSGKFSADLDTINKGMMSLQTTSASLQANVGELNNAFNTMRTSTDTDKRIDAMRTYQSLISGVRAEIANLTREQAAEEKQIATLCSDIQQIGKLNSQLTLADQKDINNFTVLETKLSSVTQKAFDMYSSLGGSGLNTNALTKINDTLDVTFNELGTNVRKQLDTVDKAFQSLGKQPQSIAKDIRLLYTALDTLASPTADFATKLDTVSTLRSVFPNVQTQVQNLSNAETELARKAKEAAEALALSDKKAAFGRKVQDEINNLIPTTQKFKTELEDIKSKVSTADKSQLSHLKAEFDRVSESVRKEEKAVQDAAKAQQTLSKSSTLSNNIQTWMNNNKKAAEQFGQELTELRQKLNGNTDATALQNINLRFKEIQSEAKAAGLVTNTFATSLKEVGLQALGLTSAAMALQKVIGVCKTGLDTVIGLDDALVDLKKTTTMTATEITDFYKDANTVAKQYGATTQEIIQSAADWSRLGYSSKQEASTMAQLSSMMATISPGMTVEAATTGLVSVMKAYGIEAGDVLDQVMSKINAVGNTAATSNEQIVTGLENAAAAMAVTGTSFEQTVALFTAG